MRDDLRLENIFYFLLSLTRIKIANANESIASVMIVIVMISIIIYSFRKINDEIKKIISFLKTNINII